MYQLPVCAKFGKRQYRSTVYAYMPNFVSISLFCCPLAAKTPQILPVLDFGVLWCRQLAACGESLMRRCTTTNLPLFSGIIIVSVLQHLYGEVVCTNCRSKKLSVFGRRGGGWSPTPTKFGTAIRGPRPRSCTFKTFGGVTEIRPHQLKTPITS